MFSPNGNRLAAGLSTDGLRVYARDRGWDEAARDEDYGDRVNGADFAPDGRLATSSSDGQVRLYAPDMVGAVRPSSSVTVPGGKRPYGIAFGPTRRDASCGRLLRHTESRSARRA